MTPDELRAKMVQRREEVSALREYYTDLFPPEFMVNDGQFSNWIRQYGFDYAVTAFEAGERELNKVQQDIDSGDDVSAKPFTKIGFVKWLSKVMVLEKQKAERHNDR